MELDQPQNVVNILVFCNHLAKHVMAYVTPNQTVKTIAKFQWQGYISIFGALAKLLSDRGSNFKGNIIRELCEVTGIQEGEDFYLTILKPIERWNELTKCWCAW